MSRKVEEWNRYGHVMALRSESPQKRETTCAAGEPVEVANMGIEMILCHIEGKC